MMHADRTDPRTGETVPPLSRARAEWLRGKDGLDLILEIRRLDDRIKRAARLARAYVVIPDFVGGPPFLTDRVPPVCGRVAVNRTLRLELGADGSPRMTYSNRGGYPSWVPIRPRRGEPRAARFLKKARAR